jgi:hypothetical protein
VRQLGEYTSEYEDDVSYLQIRIHFQRRVHDNGVLNSNIFLSSRTVFIKKLQEQKRNEKDVFVYVWYRRDGGTRKYDASGLRLSLSFSLSLSLSLSLTLYYYYYIYLVENNMMYQIII